MIEKIKIRNAILQNKMYSFKKDISDPARFESQFREVIDKDIFELSPNLVALSKKYLSED